MRPLCAHCRKVPATRPRGLCWPCYYTRGVRDRYPVAPRRAVRPSNVVRCWACPATTTSGSVVSLGWAVRRVRMPGMERTREIYCPACFAAHGWPECPPLVSAEAVRVSVGYDLPRVYRVGR